MGIDPTRRQQQQKEEALQLAVRRVWRYEWRARNRILVVQFGTNANEAKVFKAHAAPQGSCGNLANALKLLANQHDDSPIQNIVTGLREKSRERITNGLRSFIALDNHCAVEVGHLRKGPLPFRVKKRKKGKITQRF